MEGLSQVLQPYKDLVGTIAAVVTTGQMFAGSFICYDIYKQGITKGIPIMPFLGGLIMSLLNLKFGFILRDDMMIQVNFFGLALNIVYLTVYYCYAERKSMVWLALGEAGVFSAALLGYAEMEDPAVVEKRFGAVITIFMFFLIASPLFQLKTIIKNKSTQGLPFPMILSGAVVTCTWLVYGIILNNSIIILQNIVVFTLCSIQLSLFVIYPSKPKQNVSEKKKK